MDLKIEKHSFINTHKKSIIAASLALMVALSLLLGSTPEIRSTDIVLSAVKNGDVNSSTTGVGQIKSLKQWQITANESGHLVEILKNVGDSIHQGDVILRLKNNKITQLENSLKQDIELLETELLSTRLRLMATQSEKQNQSKKNKLLMETTALELAAIKELVNKGIMPKLKLAQVEAKAQGARLDFELSKALLVSSQKMIDAEIMLKKGKVKRAQAELQNIRVRIQDLDVRSPITGILQSVNEKYGSKILEGEKLASVSNTQQMKASFILPEQDSTFVHLGKSVTIKTSQGQLAATISLIKPAIKNGAIEVEARFTEQIPLWLKPDLPLQAVVTGNSSYTGLYVKKPAEVNHNAEITVYRMDRKRKALTPVLVKFGRQMEQYIAIQSGLTAGDMIVFSSQVPLSGQYINISN